MSALLTLRPVTAPSTLEDCERLFRRNGLPSFVEDHRATEGSFARAAPALATAGVVELVMMVGTGWSLPQRLLAGTATAVVVLVAFVAVNRLRGRAWWSTPRRAGVPWLAGFVLLPAAAAVLSGLGPGTAAVLAGGNLAVLGVIVIAFEFGLIATVAGSSAGLLEELGASFTSTLRSLPLLVVFGLVLFMTTETWQIFTAMPAAFVAAVVALFAGLALLFLGLRLPGQVRALERDAGGGGPPPRARQRVNVGLVLAVREVLQVLVVAGGVGLFFRAYGALTVGPQIYDTWGVTGGAWTLRPRFLGYPLELSASLVRVSLGLTAICSLYYVIAISNDPNYREDFLDRVAEDMRHVFEARARYLELRSPAGGPSGTLEA